MINLTVYTAVTCTYGSRKPTPSQTQTIDRYRMDRGSENRLIFQNRNRLIRLWGSIQNSKAVECSTQLAYNTLHTYHSISQTTYQILSTTALRSKHQRHLKKVLETKDRAVDGRFRGETSFVGDFDVGIQLMLDSTEHDEVAENWNNFVDNTSDEFEDSIQIDDSTWHILPECDDSFDDMELEEEQSNRDLNDSEISSSLLSSIEETEKRWREIGNNFGRRDCGTSRSSYYRKIDKKITDELEDRYLPKINTYFEVQPRRRVYDTDEEVEHCPNNLGEATTNAPVQSHFNIEEAVDNLRPLVIDSRAKSSASNSQLPWEITRARAVYKYFLFVLEGLSKMESSENVAFFFYPHATKSKGLMKLAEASKSYKARSIRLWADQYLKTGTFQKYEQGQHVKTFSVINNETNRKRIHVFLRALSDEERTPRNFMEECNKPGGLLTMFRNAPTKICYETAKRWMISLGFKATVASKGWFTDSHERKDVVDSRARFLEEMAEIESRMTFYRGDNMSIPIPPVLLEGQKEAVLVTHDESTFYCNKGR